MVPRPLAYSCPRFPTILLSGKLKNEKWSPESVENGELAIAHWRGRGEFRAAAGVEDDG